MDNPLTEYQLKILEFWTVGRKKQDIRTCPQRLWGIMTILHNFLTFYWWNSQLINLRHNQNINWQWKQLVNCYLHPQFSQFMPLWMFCISVTSWDRLIYIISVFSGNKPQFYQTIQCNQQCIWEGTVVRTMFMYCKCLWHNPNPFIIMWIKNTALNQLCVGVIVEKWLMESFIKIVRFIQSLIS